MDYTYSDGRLYLRRNADEKKPLLQRLKRIEGQVRGLQAMIDEDRYCLDEIQQMNAISAAVREAALQIIAEHLEASADYASRGEDREGAVAEMIRVLRAAMRQG
ncbi:metal-sensitive transcriptional regulator [Methylobacterium oryzihabitans]|jgi:DNA-binding FrmR family transcriptional regulator|uniref:Transcriptional regulator n=1 Tax=Methylobacterium oryzihabitans TaxID=2499852 RepID=A0A3S2YMM6_9HYPH|nr:metal-sensitive transcriptional regulator [Methylobacterium oryzihabitans]RVU14987.1 transcriptional regulator [Methylobacterium oryzihabitans]